MVTAFEDISLGGVKTVLIDLDNTLYPYDPAHDEAMKSVFEFETFGLSFETFCQFYMDKRRDVIASLVPQAGSRSRLFAFLRMTIQVKEKDIYPTALRMETLYWDRFMRVMALDKGAEIFLQRCKTMGIPVCIVTDMQAGVQIRKIGALGLWPYIAHMATSEEAGAEKPYPAIFELALKRMACSAEEVIMIGDNDEKDIVGAEGMGIRAFQVCLEAGQKG